MSDYVGRRVEIKPAYNSETGDRDIWDDVAGCEAVIRSVRDDGDVVVDIKSGERDAVIAWSRVRLLGKGGEE